MNKVEKTYHIKASQSDVFDVLTNVDRIEEWSGSRAKMDIVAGGEFSLWDGTIHGINQEVTDAKIVQLWKEVNWEAYSNCVFTLTGNDGATILLLVHSGIPDASVASIDRGWDEYYLGPLKEMLEN